MNKLQLFCLLIAAFRLAECQSELSGDALEFCDSLFTAPIDSASISTLSGSYENTGKLSLTQGGSNLESYNMHQSATVILSALQKVKNSSFNETTKNLMMNKYYVPNHYCPNHDYNYYKCDDKYKYRRVDGSCNNLYVPWWGKTNTPYERLVGPDYDDGVSTPKTKSKVHGKLPNPRKVAMAIHDAMRTFPKTTQMLTFFGQHIQHDIIWTSRASYRNGEEKRCGCRDHHDSDCFQVPVPYDDYYNRDQKCFPFTRSSASTKNFDCKLSYREQNNIQTHWLDLSNIYGPNSHQARKLRTYKYGLLHTSKNPVTGYPDLPVTGNKDCKYKEVMDSCFMKGDSRGEDNQYLYMFNLIYVTEHNRIAKVLYDLNPKWDDDHLYEEARKINIGQYQHIVYYEYLPMMLGSYAMKRWRLIPEKDGFFTGYDAKLSPQVKNVYATAAGRHGHPMINKFHYKYSNDYDLKANYTTHFVLHKHTYHPFDHLRGSLLQNSYVESPHINEYLNNWLFEGMSKNWKRLSLATLNINRGRDHGLAGYNEYRNWCGLGYAYDFDDLTNIPASVRYELKKLYKSVDDIDPFTGITSEYAVEDGVLGYTAACIIGEGMFTWKYGDRFYYEINKHTGFTANQLREIKKASMSRLMCDNSDMYMVQEYPFLEVNERNNAIKNCNEFAKVDLKYWKE